MTDAPATKYQGRITLTAGGLFHFFHDGIADGLAVFLPLWQTSFGLFYTFVIAAAALAPPIMGRVSEILGLDDSIRLIGWIALSTVPMALVLARQTVALSKENQNIH